jgi:hypothetical protein
MPGGKRRLESAPSPDKVLQGMIGGAGGRKDSSERRGTMRDATGKPAMPDRVRIGRTADDADQAGPPASSQLGAPRPKVFGGYEKPRRVGRRAEGFTVDRTTGKRTPISTAQPATKRRIIRRKSGAQP